MNVLSQISQLKCTCINTNISNLFYADQTVQFLNLFSAIKDSIIVAEKRKIIHSVNN